MNEKDINLLISALSCYHKEQERQAAKENKRGEAGKARRCEEESKHAWKLMMSFADMLCQPSGSIAN